MRIYCNRTSSSSNKKESEKKFEDAHQFACKIKSRWTPNRDDDNILSISCILFYGSLLFFNLFRIASCKGNLFFNSLHNQSRKDKERKENIN